MGTHAKGGQVGSHVSPTFTLGVDAVAGGVQVADEVGREVVPRVGYPLHFNDATGHLQQ